MTERSICLCARRLRSVTGLGAAARVRALRASGRRCSCCAAAARGSARRRRVTSFSCVWTAAGGSGLVEPAAVAVDRSSGRIFVSDAGAGVVDVYDSSGTFVTEFGGGGLDGAGVAVDEASGLVYVADPFENEVFVFKPVGGGYELIGEWDGSSLPGQGFGEVTGVAVDNDPS